MCEDGAVKLGALVWPQYTDWQSLRDTGELVDRAGYDSLWTWDHLYPIVGDPEGPMFEGYLTAGDFPGADMARKFLQMGWTRARRYANHKGGRKYEKETGAELPRTVDDEKAAAAAVFYERYVAARQHPEYLRLKKRHQEQHERK